MIVDDFFRLKLRIMRWEMQNIMCVIMKSACQNKGQVEAGIKNTVVCCVSWMRKST